MIATYRLENERAVREEWSPEKPLDASAIWLDLHHPTEGEEDAVEALMRLDLPTRAEMQEIEISSRIYQENGAYFLTALLPAQTESEDPEVGSVTFVLTPQRLVTIRYIDPVSFKTFSQTVQKTGRVACTSPVKTLGGLLDAIVDRIADILEKIGSEADGISRTVFQRRFGGPRRRREEGPSLEDLIVQIGRAGDLTTKARDSLLTLARIVSYVIETQKSLTGAEEVINHYKTISRDIQSLSDQAGFLSSKVNFLLDATLGLINLEQNSIIKIFSIAAVIFLPPTLIASIYGMNFEHMPELAYPHAYPVAIGLMLVSAVLPLWYFKRKGWM